MSITESLLPEFDQEMATTRRVLERTPEAHVAWKPHPKSFSLGDLAMHVAHLPYWTEITFKQTEFDVHPPGGSQEPPRVWKSTASLVESFDVTVKNARAVLAATDDKDCLVPWSLKNGGAVAFTLPRIAVFRSFCMNHLIHHRGQLTVYLRLKDVPLPMVYGPTADARP